MMIKAIHAGMLVGLMTCSFMACVPVTEPPPSLSAQPSGCDKVALAGLVDSFFRGWNAQDSAGVAALFGTTFSLEDGLSGGRTMVSDRTALANYLKQRFAAGDAISEVKPDVPNLPSPANANATASFKRRVGTAQLRGNAKFVCSDGRLQQLTMSAE